MPGTFSGNEEMLALGLGMKGLNNSVFELSIRSFRRR